MWYAAHHEEMDPIAMTLVLAQYLYRVMPALMIFDLAASFTVSLLLAGTGSASESEQAGVLGPCSNSAVCDWLPADRSRLFPA